MKRTTFWERSNGKVRPPSLIGLSRSKLHRILTQGQIRPHKIRYYVERRDPEFERKMVEVLHVYKEVEILNAGLVEGTLNEPTTVTISYDEKPGIQALATTTPDRPPEPNKFASHQRDYEYQRLGTVSLLAGLDLHTGRVTELVSDRHASADFIALLGKLDAAYPPQIRIRLLLDNHSAHISKRDASLVNPSSPAVRVCLYAQAWIVAEHHRNSIQQNGPQYAAGYSCRQQTGID